jgi:RNA polymerase sigma factor (sigma-70 family)
MAIVSDNLAKRCLAKLPGADNDMAVYLMTNLPKWIRFYFTRMSPLDVDEAATLSTVHILKHISKFKGQSSFDTWARKVARNFVYDEIAKADRYRKKINSLDIQNTGSGFSPYNVIPSRMKNPREEMDRREIRELIVKALGRLRNSRQKLILEEFYINGLDLPEISQRWGGISRSKLSLLKWQALKAVLKIVKDLQPGSRLEEYSSRLLRRY